MKKNVLHLFVMIGLMMTLIACNTAQSKIDELQNLVTEVQAEYKTYTQEDWRGVNEAYEALLIDMEQYDYTTEQRKQIGRLKGQYEALVMKYTFTNLPNMLEEAAGEFVEGVGSFLEEMSTDKVSEELKNSGDELVEGVEAFLDELVEE